MGNSFIIKKPKQCILTKDFDLKIEKYQQNDTNNDKNSFSESTVINDSKELKDNYWKSKSQMFADSYINRPFNSYEDSNFQIGFLIEKGELSEVYECLEQNTGQTFVVKKIKVDANLQKDQKNLLLIQQSIKVLSNLSHPNIVIYHGSDIDLVNKCINIYQEYVPGGSVKSILKKFGKLDEKIVSIYTNQIIQGLQYLHSNGIIHRDIKAGNILINTDIRVKLSDFGSFYQQIQNQDTDISYQNLSTYLKNSSNWMAPEVAQRQQHGRAADVWSLGCVVIEMLDGRPPYSNISNNAQETIRLIVSGKKPIIPPKISNHCKEFITSCLRYHPDDRLTLNQLKNLPFLQNQQQQQNIQQSLYGQFSNTELSFLSNAKTLLDSQNSMLFQQQKLSFNQSQFTNFKEVQQMMNEIKIDLQSIEKYKIQNDFSDQQTKNPFQDKKKEWEIVFAKELAIVNLIKKIQK